MCDTIGRLEEKCLSRDPAESFGTPKNQTCIWMVVQWHMVATRREIARKRQNPPPSPQTVLKILPFFKWFKIHHDPAEHLDM